MASRMEKYLANQTDSSTSRTSRNRSLYDDIYTNTNYNNSVVIDDTKEIDIDKIKELIEKEKTKEEKKTIRPTIDLYKELRNIKDETEEKIYDINEVLKEAKNKRDIIQDANEKRKTYIDKYESHLNIEEELNKTKKAYDRLLQEETELLDIMNTLTNSVVNSEDSYKDLTTEANKLNTGKIETKQIENDNKEVTDKSEEYSTNTFMFDKRDFVSGDIDDQMIGASKSLKVFIFLLSIAIILGAYYIITNYVLK